MRKSITIVLTVLLGLLMAAAPNGRHAAAQGKKTDTPEFSNEGFIPFFLEAFVYPLESPSEVARVHQFYDSALEALVTGDKRKFDTNLRRLRAREEDFDAGPASIRRLAQDLMDELPEGFEPGFVYKREDGTIAADPDGFIRSQLARDKDSSSAGDGGGAGQD